MGGIDVSETFLVILYSYYQGCLLPIERTLDLTKFKSSLPKDGLCQVWLKLIVPIVQEKMLRFVLYSVMILVESL